MPDIVIKGIEVSESLDIILNTCTNKVVYSKNNGMTWNEATDFIVLPEGHGDLIERKRVDIVPDHKDVRNGIKRIVKETKRDGRTIAEISTELLVQTLVALDELRSVRRYFENAKTILPAEGDCADV